MLEQRRHRVVHVGLGLERGADSAPRDRAGDIFDGVAEDLPFMLFPEFYLIVEPAHENTPLLVADQARVHAAQCKQFVVRAALHDPA